jgi:hypothetical protein
MRRGCGGGVGGWTFAAEVGMESEDAGWQRTLFSETRAAAVQWAIMNPLFKPNLLKRAHSCQDTPMRDKKWGEARKGRVDQPLDASLGYLADFLTAIKQRPPPPLPHMSRNRKHVQRLSRVLPVEISAGDDGAVSRKYHRVVRRGVDFAREDVVDPRGHVVAHAVHLRGEGEGLGWG